MSFLENKPSNLENSLPAVRNEGRLTKAIPGETVDGEAERLTGERRMLWINTFYYSSS
jgi:hypothetical protein